MAFVADQFFAEMDATISNEWVDFDEFLDLPSSYDDQSTATTVSPQDLALPYEADGIFTSPSDFMQSSFDMTNCDLPQEFMGMDGSFMQDPAAPLFDDAAFLAYNPYESSNTFRNLVEAQAAADPRVASIKEKRREAGIALHLQRLCDDTALDLDMSSDSNTSFSSPSWSEYVRESISPRPSSETTYVSEASRPGGMEMILDLNMNAAANVPRKQKPRSQAQKENYIKARKYGACEKHKKQHKRCNCLEKAAARVSDVPMNAALQPRPRQTMPQVPVSEARYSESPGHNTSFSPAQALPTIKAIRKPTGCSYGVDPYMGLPVAVPTAKQNIKTKTQKNTPPGHEIVLLSGKLNSNSNCTSNQDIVLTSNRNTAKGHCTGHDTLLSGKNVPNTSCAGHDRLVTQEKTSKNTASGQPHNTCNANSPRPAHAAGVSSGSSSLRWCVSTSSVGVVWSEKTAVKTSSANHSTACVGRTPSLDVHRTRSTPTMATSMVPGTVAGCLGMRHSTSLRNSGTQLLGSHHRASEGVAWQISTLSGLLSVPNDLPVSPTRRGSSGLSGTRWPLLISGDGLRVGPAAKSARLLLTTTASAISGAWQSSLSVASGFEGVVYKALSLFGRQVTSAKKDLYLGALRNACI